MSESESGSGSGSGPGTREVARRLFAAEYDDADFSYSESDEERAPNYVVLPTGARVNRLFAVGVLTEVGRAGDEILRARVADPSGAFVVYAGQYQPEAMTFLERQEPPAFVALTGKARTFQPDDSDAVYTSVRPESVNTVDADTRNRWVLTAAERTLERIGVVAWALDSGLRGGDLRAALREAGVEASLAAGVPLAIDHYGTSRAYLAALQELALDAIRLVAGDIEEVAGLDVPPDAGGEPAFTPVRPFEPGAEAETEGSGESGESTAPAGATATGETAGASTTEAGVETEADVGAESDAGAGSTSESEPESESGDGAAAEPDRTGRVEAGTESGGEDAVAESTGESASAEESAPTSRTETEAGTVDAEFEPVEESDVDIEEVAAAEAAETGSGPGDGAIPEPGENGTDETVEEPASESGAVAADDDLGDFESGGLDEDEFDDVLDEETREEVAEEYGTQFETGTEVAPAGEADIEPEAGSTADAGSEPESESGVESDSEAGFGPEPEPDTGEATPAEDAAERTEAETAGEVDVETALLEAMATLDDGDGAPRAELITRVQERAGVSEAEVESAIEEALMSGQCYEPGEDRLKPI